MGGEPQSVITSVADAYERHNDRWRNAMRSMNLDPDSRADQCAMPTGFWFEMQDLLRRDLTAAAGRIEDAIVKRHVRSSASDRKDDELATLRADLNRLMGHS